MLHFLKNIFVCAFMHAVCGYGVPVEAGGGHWIPGSWSYRRCELPDVGAGKQTYLGLLQKQCTLEPLSHLSNLFISSIALFLVVII